MMKRIERRKTACIALLVGTLSFGLTIAALASSDPYWPNRCGYCSLYGPGGRLPDRVTCDACCDTYVCESAGAGAVTLCKNCCSQYNNGNPNGSHHCLGANYWNGILFSSLDASLSQQLDHTTAE